MSFSANFDLTFVVQFTNIFMTNFQDHDTARFDQTDLQLKLKLKKQTLIIPSSKTFTLKKDQSVILPFNLSMEGALLKYSTTQLLAKVEEKNAVHYFFFAPEGLRTEYSFDKSTLSSGKEFYTPKPGLKSTFSITVKNGKTLKITTLTRQQALNTTKVNNHILITEATVLPEKEQCTLLSLGKTQISYALYTANKGWKEETIEVQPVDVKADWKTVGTRRMTVKIDQPDVPQVNDYFLRVNYVADVAMAFIGGYLVLDHYYYGIPWTIGLRRFKNELKNEYLSFYFRPLRKDAPFIGDLPVEAIPDFSQKDADCLVRSVDVIPEYKAIVNI